MAWLWQRDIDDEKRTPGLIFRIKSALAPKSISLGRAERILSEIGLKPGQTVLDFGCGPGQFTIAAARLVGDKGYVHALDVHPTALEMVGGMASERGLSNVETIYSDLDTGLDEASVDAVLLFDAVRKRKDVSLVLREIHRILKPQGSLHVRGSGMKPGRIEDLMVKDGHFRLRGSSGSILSFEKVEGSFREVG
jgi:ubiquinone/menaquinone biosynthesis C-methylase UbiE